MSVIDAVYLDNDPLKGKMGEAFQFWQREEV